MGSTASTASHTPNQEEKDHGDETTPLEAEKTPARVTKNQAISRLSIPWTSASRKESYAEGTETATSTEETVPPPSSNSNNQEENTDLDDRQPSRSSDKLRATYPKKATISKTDIPRNSSSASLSSFDSGTDSCSSPSKVLRKYAAIEPILEDHLASSRAQLGSEHPDTMTHMYNLATLYHKQGKLEDGAPLFTECMERREAVLGNKHVDTLQAMYSLAVLYYAKSDCTKAQPLFENCYERRKATLGPDHMETLKSMNSLALLYDDMSQLERAEPLFRECLERRKKILGHTHQLTLDTSHNLLVLNANIDRMNRMVPVD